MAGLIIVAALAAVLLIYIVLVAPGRLPKNAQALLWRSAYAHRGLHTKDKTVPENSMAAFQAAVEGGYGIELDINMTIDDEIVVFHDDTLLRICGVDKAITSCTYEELKAYRLLDTDEGIPLFRDVLAMVAGRVPLVVELKGGRRNAALCDKAAALLDTYSGVYCIESFYPGIVRWFKKNRPQTVRGQLSAARKSFGGLPVYKAVILSSRPHFVAYKHTDVKGRCGVAFYRWLGGKLLGWTVRDTDNVDVGQEHFDAIIFEFFRPLHGQERRNK
jgi:glycerophosphoryl diester phosphodiesterase